MSVPLLVCVVMGVLNLGSSIAAFRKGGDTVGHRLGIQMQIWTAAAVIIWAVES